VGIFASKVYFLLFSTLQIKAFFLNYFFIYYLFEFTHVFQPSFDDISAIGWSILMQDTVLERLLVVD
jgi:hypothetical protein